MGRTIRDGVLFVHGEDTGQRLPEAQWLECLDAPIVAAPSAYVGQGLKNYVPNNDRDVVEAKRLRGAFESEADYQKDVAKQRTGKIVRAHIFNASIPLLYAWTFEPGADAERHARAICEIAGSLYQLGRGVDMAWATGEVVDEADARLRANGGVQWRPNQDGGGAKLSCPRVGSLASLTKRFKAMRGRFKSVGEGKRARLLFSQAPKPYFRQAPYNSPSAFLLFEIRDADGFASQSFKGTAALTEKIRDLAVKRLKDSAWRRDDPKRETLADKIFIGRDSQEADKARRICIVPLPSIGHAQTERSIRRVLVAVPPDCPVATGDIAWAFSGLVLVDPETGEVADDSAELVATSDDAMLAHYGVEDAARLWRTVTPAALPERAARRRIDPRRIREEAKGGAERLSEHAAAEWAARQALRHAGIGASVETIRVQREPFEAKGLRAEAFARGARFAMCSWRRERCASSPSS